MEQDAQQQAGHSCSAAPLPAPPAALPATTPAALAPRAQAAGGTGSLPPLRFSQGVLRPWRLDDAAAVQRHANDRELWRFMSDRFPFPYTQEDATAWVRSCIDDGDGAGEEDLRRPPTQLAIELDGAGVVGGIGVVRREGVQRRTLELGYWLGQEHWGRGAGSGAVAAFLPYVFSSFPDAERIEALVYAHNGRSCAVLARLGFEQEGRLRRAVFKGGEFCDTLVWGLLRSDAEAAVAAAAAAAAARAAERQGKLGEQQLRQQGR